MGTLRLVFICRVFQSRLQVVLRLPSLVGVETIAVFARHVQWNAWPKLYSATWVVGNASYNNSFTIIQSSGKRSLHLLQKSDHSCE